METLEYAPGRAVDVHRGGDRGYVLVWHGRGPNQRPALTTLGSLVAGRGLTVIVPDWSSANPDGGRADLLASLRFTVDLMEREDADPASLVLVGWSLGGAAAIGVVMTGDELGARVTHVVGLGNGGYRGDEPITGGPIPAELPRGDDPTPFTLLHGVADDVAPVAGARAFTQQLEQQDWPVELVELPTDHWGIVGTSYVAVTDSCIPAEDDATHRVVRDVADRIAATALSHAPR